MTSDRIKEIQKSTEPSNIVNIKQVLLKVWEECEQLQSENERLKEERDVLPKLEKGDRIKLYGKETEVIGFEAAWNDGLNPPGYEIILLTIGRGDPFKRSLNCIEVLPPPKQ